MAKLSLGFASSLFSLLLWAANGNALATVVPVSTITAAIGTATSTNLPTADYLVNPATGMVCSDISATNAVDDPWFSAALCSVLSVNPQWISDNMIGLEGGDAMVNVYNGVKWEATMVPYQAGQNRGGLMDDSNGFCWWPAAYRIAAMTAGFPGQVNGDSMAGGMIGTGLEILTGNTVAIFNITTGENPISQAVLQGYFEDATKNPIIVQTSPTAATLIKGAHYSVLNYTASNDWCYLDGLDGNSQYFKFSDIFPDLIAGAQVNGP